MRSSLHHPLFSDDARHRGFVTTLVALILFIFAVSARAQTQPTTTESYPPMSADDLPDAALQGDLLGVAAIDFQVADKSAWNNTFLVLTGGRATTRPLGPNDPLPPALDQSFGPVFKMGAQRLIYGVSFYNGNTAITLCFRLADGTSEDAADAWLHKNLGNRKTFEHDGAWLVTRFTPQGGGAVPDNRPVSPQADEIRQDINCWGDDVPFKVVYPTSNRLKEQFARNGPPPAAIADIYKLYWDAKYLYVGAKLGAEPQLEMRWVAPDADGADAVIKALAASLNNLKQPNNGIGIPTAFITPLAQLHPTREDNVVRVSLNRKDLTGLVTAFIAAAMTQQNTGGSQNAAQSPVAADWAPTDVAVDSASDQMRLILSAIIEYDNEHQSLPASIADLTSAGLVPGPEIFHDPRTGKDDGFIYVKLDGVTKLSDIADRKTTGILFEEKDGQADRTGLVGYADGHVGMGK
jgi:hypothetical protein